MYNTCKLLQSSESNTKLKNNRAVEIYPQCHPERNFNEAQGCSEVPSGGWGAGEPTRTPPQHSQGTLTPARREQHTQAWSGMLLLQWAVNTENSDWPNC